TAFLCYCSPGEELVAYQWLPPATRTSSCAPPFPVLKGALRGFLMQRAEYIAYLTLLEGRRESIDITVMRLVNRASKMTEVWIEPWGDMIALDSGSHCDVVACGPSGATYEISAGNVLTVQWDGDAFRI